jgi:hypothetical protein
MPATWLDDPEQWWARGEHARLMAEQLADREAKRILLDIAEGYEPKSGSWMLRDGAESRARRRP